MRPTRRFALATLALLLVPFGLGCTGTGEGAASQLRSALESDQLPEQYEPEVEASNDEFQPEFGD